MNGHAILETIQSQVPHLLAVYAFGSRLNGTAGPHSDLDLAVLVAGYAEPLALWSLSGDLADAAGCPVDLLDLRAASTVMQHQIITTGQRWWARDAQATLYEAAILSEKTALDTARAGLREDCGKGVAFKADDGLISRAASIERCVTVAIIQKHLDEFLQFSQGVLLRDGAQAAL